MYRNPIELPPKTTVVYVDEAYLTAYGVGGICMRTRKQAERTLNKIGQAVREVRASTDTTWKAPELWPAVSHFSSAKLRNDFAHYKKQVRRAYATFPICFYPLVRTAHPHYPVFRSVETHERAHVVMFERMRRYGDGWIYLAAKLLTRTLQKCREIPALIELENTIREMYIRAPRENRAVYNKLVIHEILARVASILDTDEFNRPWIGYHELGNRPSQHLTTVVECVEKHFGTFNAFVSRVDRMAA